jgi:hypothetical protein
MAIASAIYFVFEALIVGSDAPGYPSLIVSIMFFAGIQLMSLGIIGEYVGRIFAEVKRARSTSSPRRWAHPEGSAPMRDERQAVRI